MNGFLDRRNAAGLAIVALVGVVSVLAYPRLPEQMAIHFDANSQPDSYLGKPLALALLPAIALVVLGFFKLIPVIDPLGENIESFGRYYDGMAVYVVGVLAYAQGVVIAYNLGYQFDVSQVLAPLLAVTYVVAGVVIENASQNWFVGIRTPWTLSDEEVWDLTHERCAVLFKAAGVLAVGGLVFPEFFAYFAIAPVALAALAASAYSFVLYRRKKRGELG